jgi:hypothetical protein
LVFGGGNRAGLVSAVALWFLYGHAAHRGDDALLGGLPLARRGGRSGTRFLLSHAAVVDLGASGAV